MKIIYSLFLACFLPLAANAQITITFSDLPDVGSSLWQVSDSTQAPALSGSLSGGANVSWNFASGWEVRDTSKITFAATTTVSNTISSLYPLANLVYDRVEDSTAMFFSRLSTGFYVAGSFLYGTLDLGGNAVSNVPTIYSQPELIVPVPFTYNDSISSTAHSNTSVSLTVAPFGLVNIEQNSRTVKNFKCQGYGTLTTPSGMYSNALFMKVNVTRYDTVYTANPILGPQVNTDTIIYSTNYTWFSNDANQIMLMELGADSSGSTIESASYSYKTSTSVSPELTLLSEVKFYPVPSAGIVYFDVPSDLNAFSIRILSLDGKEIISQNMISHTKELDLSYLNNGFYLIELSSGAVSRTGKIVVSK